jgi:hypothetical protein
MRFVAVHLEKNTQRAGERLRLLLQQIRFHIAAKAGFPQHIALLVIRIEALGEAM